MRRGGYSRFIAILFFVSVLPTLGGCFLFQSPPDPPEESEGLLKQSNEPMPECLDVSVSDMKTGNKLSVSVLLENRCPEKKKFAIRPIYKNRQDKRIWPGEKSKEWSEFELNPGESQMFEESVEGKNIFEVEGIEYRSTRSD